jgi:hypothetical protein
MSLPQQEQKLLQSAALSLFQNRALQRSSMEAVITLSGSNPKSVLSNLTKLCLIC